MPASLSGVGPPVLGPGCPAASKASRDCNEFLGLVRVGEVASCQRWVAELRMSLAFLSDQCGRLEQANEELRSCGAPVFQEVRDRHARLMGTVKQLLVVNGTDIEQQRRTLSEVPAPSPLRIAAADMPPQIPSPPQSNLQPRLDAASMEAWAPQNEARDATKRSASSTVGSVPPSSIELDIPCQHGDSVDNHEMGQLSPPKDHDPTLLSLHGPVACVDGRLRFHDVQARAVPRLPRPSSLPAGPHHGPASAPALCGASEHSQPYAGAVVSLPNCEDRSLAGDRRSTGSAVDSRLNSRLRSTISGSGSNDSSVKGLATDSRAEASALPAQPVSRRESAPSTSQGTHGAAASAPADHFSSTAISDVWAKYHPSPCGDGAKWGPLQLGLRPSTLVPPPGGCPPSRTLPPLPAGPPWLGAGC